MVTEGYSNTTTLMEYYGSQKYPVVHFPFNFAFAVIEDYFTSKTLHGKITEWLNNMPKHGVANWVVSDSFPHKNRIKSASAACFVGIVE